MFTKETGSVGSTTPAGITENNTKWEKAPNNTMETSLTNITSSTAYIISKDAEQTQDAHDPHPTTHPTSFVETMIHLLKGNIGSGMLAFGEAYKHAGLGLAPVLTVVLGFICVYSQHILLNTASVVMKRLNLDHVPDFAATVEYAFTSGPPSFRRWGTFMRRVCNTFLCITQIGFCCVYFMFISKNLKLVFDYYDMEFAEPLHMLYVFVPILLCTWVRNLKYMVPLSMIANVFMFVGIGTTLYLLSWDLPPVSDRNAVGGFSDIALFIGTALYAFEGISLILPLKKSMKEAEKFDSTFGVLNLGMIFVTCLLVAVGFLGYLHFGEKVSPSITTNFPKEDIITQVINIVIALGVLFTYPLQMYVPIAIMWPVINSTFGPFRHPVITETIFRSALVLLTFSLAASVPNLGTFISLIGALSSCTLALLFPPLLEVVIVWENKSRFLTLFKDSLLLIFGLICCGIGTYFSTRDLIDSFRK